MSGRRFGAVVVGLLGVVIAIAVGIHHHRSQTTFSSYSAPADDAPSASPAGAVDDGSSIVVDVAGKVRHSGLVTLPVGARVADAIKAAGGAVRQRDLDEVDLAQRVTDGELLTVGPRHGRHASGASSKLVDLSTASMTKLETLPGVGPVTAQKIVDWRTAHGGFTSVSELQQVSGIGPAHYAELSPLVAP
jgi:competence protein ComEA